MLATDNSELIPLDGGELRFWPCFLEAGEADALLLTLHREIPWEQSRIRIAGREIPIPRLNAWCGDPGAHYSYSGVGLSRHAWTPALLRLREAVEEATGLGFNSALLNYYRDGRDSVDWHSDDEPELGPNPVVASVSLGAERRFELRRRDDRKQRFKLVLPHGALLLMAGELQGYWQHRLPKDGRLSESRINITFRRVINQAGTND